MKTIFNWNHMRVALFFSCTAMIAPFVHAVDDSFSKRRAKASGEVIEEIIVTAEKRAKNLQDVPSAITAYTSEKLEIRGIADPQDLQFSVPGLSIGETSIGSVQITMRGIGAENTAAGGDPGVPIHINGHYMQFSNYALHDLFDVERVEVQRGPQGTLYGRNAVGGNINIITKRPTETFEGQFSLDVGNYDKRKVQSVVSGSLTDRLRGRIAVSGEKRDGFVTNVSSRDDELLNSDYTSVRGSLDYELTDNIEILLGVYSYNDKSTSFVSRVVGEYPAAGMYAGIPGGYTNISASDLGKVRLDAPNGGYEDASGFSLDLSWDMGSITFRSLSAYNDAERGIVRDADSTDLPPRQEANPLNETRRFTDVMQGSRTYTQEFQLLSPDDSEISWVAGLFYFEEESNYHLRITVPSTPVIFRIPADVETDSVAVFGQIDYPITELLEVTTGLRYTKDKKYIDRSIFFAFDGVNNLITPANSTLDDSWQKVSGKLGINYYAVEDIMLYASYSLGFKAGGFNPTSVSEPSYEPETLDAYEIGMKGQFMGNRLQLNASAFYYDYNDKTESTISVLPGQTTGTTIFTNAASARIVGMDLEIQAYLTDSVVIDASVGYMNSEYEKFISRDPQFDPPGVGQDLSGNQLTRTPEWKFNVGVQQVWQLRNDMGSLVARIDYSWIDEQYFRAFNLESDKADSYHRTNARLKWESGNANWQIETYVLNIEDDYVLSNIAVASPDFGFQHGGSYLPPRTFGLKATYSF